MGDLFEITSSKRVHQSEWTDAGVQFYRARELVALHDGQSITPLHISEELYERNAALSGEIREGHLLVTGVGSIGVPYLVRKNDRFYFKDGNIIWLKNSGSTLIGEFLHLLYCSDIVQRQITTMAGVGTVGTYTIDNAKRTIAIFPAVKDEQKKIADCLTSLDEVIAAQGRKVEALKVSKHGLMQQLFPREGETRPRLRFPEFRKASEWEVKKLSTLIDLVSGMHLSPDQYSSSGDVPYFTGPSDFTHDVERVTKWAVISSNVATEHDTLITVKGSGVGECWYLEMPSVAMGRQLMAVRTKASSSQFIHQFLLTKRTRFEDLASGNLIPGLARGDILDMVAPFPKRAEQQRIADCLSSLDTQIAAESNQLVALKTHKQGLMQQLFPAPEAVGA
jgi:restriction endonuclease S subunit